MNKQDDNVSEPTPVDVVRSTDVLYVLHPGHVKSNYDGDTHFISGQQLARLYNVPLAKCIIHGSFQTPRSMKGVYKELKHLYPRSDGKYGDA